MLAGLFYKKDDCAKEYKIGEELGRGSFAIVRKAQHRGDKSDWAVKCIEKAKLDKEDEEALKVEVEILEKVDHPNIVRMRQVFDTPKTFYMIMELMTGGEMFDRIVAKSKYSESEAAAVVQKIADALLYCHKRGIVHRDLKPENLLYTSEADDATIKIADFGLAKLLRQSDVMATACGTPGYVAPEILLGRPYTEKVDIWSLGVILYILLCGFPPFYDENNAALFNQIKSGSYDFPSPYWDDISDVAKDLVRHMLVVDTAKRYSAEDVLKHPWIRGGASTQHLPQTYEQLRRYNARRRFRQGVRKVMAAQAFAKFGKLSLVAKAQAEKEAAEEEAATPAATAPAATAAAAAAAPAASATAAATAAAPASGGAGGAGGAGALPAQPAAAVAAAAAATTTASKAAAPAAAAPAAAAPAAAAPAAAAPAAAAPKAAAPAAAAPAAVAPAAAAVKR